jgi:plastocyanin
MRTRSKLAALALTAGLLSPVAARPASASGAGMAAVAVPGSFILKVWATPAVAVQVGGVLPMVSVDVEPHNVCIESYLHCGSATNAGVTLDTPTDFLVAGNTYNFFCGIHPQMTGQLIALPGV